MLALIAGTGDLPAEILIRATQPTLVCALDGFTPSVDVDIPFRIEHLGSFLHLLKDRGVTQICMVGAIRRPVIDPAAIDAETMPLVPLLQKAMDKGDDGALRMVMAIFEDYGFKIKSAHDIAPDLLPASGVYTKIHPQAWHKDDAIIGEENLARMGLADVGQACIIRVSQVVGQEDAQGTDVMLSRFHETYLQSEPPTLCAALKQFFQPVINYIYLRLGGAPDRPVTADDGILFKAPKPDQDRRADLPVIGYETVKLAAEAGLAGIVIEADGVMVLDLQSVVEFLDMQGMFLWLRPKGAA